MRGEGISDMMNWHHADPFNKPKRTDMLLTKLKAWWMELLLDWAFQTAPKETHNGKVIREMIAAYEDTFKK